MKDRPVKTPQQRAMRMAIRAEGSFINAYWAPMDTLVGAELVASIRKDVCDRTPELFTAFVATVEIVAHSLAAATGESVVGMQFRDAPEHEKAGNA